MSEQNRNILKEYFKTGKKPTEQEYEDLIDSFVNRTEDDFVKTLPPLPDATTTKKGIVEQATLTEVQAGTEDTRFVTPKGVKRAVETFAPIAPVQSVNGQTGDVIFDTGNNTIKKITKVFNINNLSTTNVYEIIPAQGSNSIIDVHTVVFDIEILTRYVGVTTGVLFNMGVNSRDFIARSPFMSINMADRKIQIIKPSGRNFPLSEFNKPINLITNVEGTGGRAVVKIAVLYSIVNFD